MSFKIFLESAENSSFKRWFANSKVVDPFEHDKPRIVYHGTIHDFTTFSHSKIGSSNDYGYAGAGFYFISDPEWASGYALNGGDNYGLTKPNNIGANVKPCYLSIQRPKILKQYPFPSVPSKEEAEEYTNNLKKLGYDGIIVPSSQSGKGGFVTEYIAFYNHQIKPVYSK